jgi:hypothetical protein
MSRFRLGDLGPPVPKPHSLRRHPRHALKAGGESRLVAILADTISQVEGPAKTAIVMTRLLGTLDEERRTAAMQLFLSHHDRPHSRFCLAPGGLRALARSLSVGHVRVVRRGGPSFRPRSWRVRDAPSARAASLASSAALPVPPNSTISRGLDHALGPALIPTHVPRVPSRQPKEGSPLVMPPSGGVERPGRVDALRAIDSTAWPRSWRTFGPRPLRRAI